MYVIVIQTRLKLFLKLECIGLKLYSLSNGICKHLLLLLCDISECNLIFNGARWFEARDL